MAELSSKVRTQLTLEKATAQGRCRLQTHSNGLTMIRLEKRRETMDKKIKDFLFDVRRSVRYHRHRQRHYVRLHTITTAGSLVMGASVVATLLSGYDNIALAAGVTITILSAIDLIIGFARMARTHDDLARRFIMLEKDAVTLGELATESYAKLWSERLMIEADEPPILRVLDSICYNEMLRSEGYDKNEFVIIGCWQKLFSNWFDFKPDLLCKQT
jgi:hypothetical protein